MTRIKTEFVGGWMDGQQLVELDPVPDIYETAFDPPRPPSAPIYSLPTVGTGPTGPPRTLVYYRDTYLGTDDILRYRVAGPIFP